MISSHKKVPLPLGEGDLSVDGDFGTIALDGNLARELADLAVDLGAADEVGLLQRECDVREGGPKSLRAENGALSRPRVRGWLTAGNVSVRTRSTTYEGSNVEDLVLDGLRDIDGEVARLAGTGGSLGSRHCDLESNE